MAERASKAAFDALHALMAEGMSEELRRGIERASQPPRIANPANANETIPNPDYEPLSPKLLAVIRAFLKDNGIDTPASSPRFNALTKELRDLDLNPDQFN